MEDYNNNLDILSTIPDPYQIVYPVHLRQEERLIDLDTRDYSSPVEVTVAFIYVLKEFFSELKLMAIILMVLAINC